MSGEASGAVPPAAARILVVDDEVELTAALCEMLGAQGYDVRGVTSGAEALAALRDGGRFDLLLTDLMIGDADGIELLRAALEIDRHLVGILMTGQGSIQTALDAMKVGVFDYLLKPFKLAFLLPILQRALEVRRLRVENEEFLRRLRAANDDLERRVRERTEELLQAQKMEAIGQLAGGIAHDFNNQLFVINGYTELLLKRFAADPAVRSYLEEVRRAGDHASGLTRQLLAFSRKQVLQPEVLDLNHVVKDAEKMLRRLLGEQIAIAVSCAPAIGGVLADPVQVQQVLINLSVNARDAMPEGGRLLIETAEFEVDTAAARDGLVPGRYVVLKVEDNGTGMDEATRARIFEPFFTTKEKGKGTGLGLSTVYGIVQQSGAHLSVESEPGRGTAFRIFFPRTQPDAAAAGGAQEAPAGGSEIVLLAEDERAVRELLGNSLQAAGYTVLAAGDGVEALRLSRQWKGHIHLLLTDVVMPHMGGPELAEQLRLLRPDTRVLYVSGYTDEAIIHQGVLDPSFAFLNKPVAIGELLRKVREVLDK